MANLFVILCRVKEIDCSPNIAKIVFLQLLKQQQQIAAKCSFYSFAKKVLYKENESIPISIHQRKLRWQISFKGVRDDSTSAFSTLHFQPGLFNFYIFNVLQPQLLNFKLFTKSTSVFSTLEIFNFLLIQLLTNSTFPISTSTISNLYNYNFNFSFWLVLPFY